MKLGPLARSLTLLLAGIDPAFFFFPPSDFGSQNDIFLAELSLWNAWTGGSFRLKLYLLRVIYIDYQYAYVEADTVGQLQQFIYKHEL